jgi:hypothetical protein
MYQIAIELRHKKFPSPHKLPPNQPPTTSSPDNQHADHEILGHECKEVPVIVSRDI